ncbi:MAG: hypothetical protein QM500_04210 [Methylococcales bacterium]
MRFNVFGKDVEIRRSNNAWCIFYLGNEGKKRLAEDIYIPSEVTESELVKHLSDLCYEWARPNNMEVNKID